MKKILIITGALLVVLAGFTHAQSPFLTYKLANPILKSGTPDTLIFDVQAKCDVTGTYHTELSVYLNYNTDAFGPSVVANNKIILVRSGLTAEEIVPGLYKYNLLPIVDNTSSRVVFGTEPALGYGSMSYLTAVPTTFTPYMKVKLVIADETELAGINYQVSLMNGNQFYQTVINNPIPYGTCVIENDFNTLPLTLPNLIISEVADPSNSSANFVEIHSPSLNSASVDFDNQYAWFLNFNGSSSVQLTGTLPAGGSYVIVNNATDFTAAYPGKPYNLVSTGVGTAGNTDYLLTAFGNYASGASFNVDAYNGSVAAFNFTGKHAVRHYPVVVPTATPSLAEWVISAAENIDMTPGSHRMTLTWDGSGGTEWRDGQNWTAAYVPDAAHNVVIPNIGVVPVITSGDNAYLYNLTINTGAGLTIESLQAGGDGSIITYGTVSGSATVKRYLGADRYYYISQPVTSAVAGVFLHIWMFTYNEPGGTWEPFIEPPATPLSLMKGYAVWSSSVNSYNQNVPPIGDTTVGYVGVLNSGANSTALTYTAVGSTYGDGWNFVGNPYPSAADWDATGWTKTSLQTNAYSVWNGTTYATWTTGVGGTNGATKNIPAAQGFFVRTTAAGSLGMTNAVRAHSTQAFWKSDEIMLNRLSLVVSNGEISDETVIHFNENATASLDYEYDAAKLLAPAAPQLYTMLGSEMMAISSFNSTSETTNVKLGMNAPETGEYTITVSNIESFDASTPIYLEDLLTSQITNLREVGSVTVAAEEGTTERFLVHFTTPQGIGDPVNGEITGIYAYNRDIYIDFNGTSGEIALYNILGQEVSRTGASNGLNIVSVPQGNAVYIVKVISENTAVTKKVFVK